MQHLFSAPQLSVSTGSLYVYPLRRTFRMAASAGYDGVELVLSVEAVLRGPAWVRELAQAHQLPVRSIHPPILSLPGWNGVAQMPRVVEFAAAAGASVVVMHTPDKARSLDDAEGRAWQRALEEVRRRGAALGVTVALENRAIFYARQRDTALAHPEALYRYAEANDLPLTLDTVHAATWPLDILDVYRLFRERLVNVHLSDLRPVARWLDRPWLHSYLKHHQLLGRGVLPITELLAEMQQDGYRGLITLELSPIALSFWQPLKAEARLAEMVRFLRNQKASTEVSSVM